MLRVANANFLMIVKKILRIVKTKYIFSNKMDNSLLAVRDINHKYILVERIKI